MGTMHVDSTAREVLAFVKENDVKFIRLGFCDLFGFQKNMAIMADALPSAFENGVIFDAHAIRGFGGVTRSDLLLFPDPATLAVLPWRPGSGRVARFYCDIRTPDGHAFTHDSRYLLKRICRQCEQMGYIGKIGAECEFYLFKTDDEGEPTHHTLDRGGYLDIAPLDKGEDIRREICLTLEEMGLQPESSHHEQGPGQNEIDFKFSDALTAADNLLTFKSVVKSVAARNGLYASFMPKPLPDAAGSGLHVNLSLAQNGANIFKDAAKNEHSPVAEHFIAGVLAKTPEITLFLNPLANSYARFGAYEAPQYVSWSHQNRSQLIRIPAAIGERVRMELRSPDPSVNPYLAFALILAAGLEGITRALPLPPPVDADLYRASTCVTEALTPLPASLRQAIRLARGSTLVEQVLSDKWQGGELMGDQWPGGELMDDQWPGGELLAKYLALKEAEADAFETAHDKIAFCTERYFGIV